MKLAAGAVAAVLFLGFYIEDWSRDFTQHEAALRSDARDELLRPMVVTRSTREMTAAVQMAARRIRNWHYVGDATEGNSHVLFFVRTNRLLRLKDDVTIRIEDTGPRRQVTGASVGRLAIGDLGRNPRNLRRLFDELRLVLQGSGYTRQARIAAED